MITMAYEMIRIRSTRRYVFLYQIPSFYLSLQKKKQKKYKYKGKKTIMIH